MKVIRSLVLSTLSAAWLLAAPALRLSETTIGPVSIAEGQNGPARSVEFTNAGDGTLNVTLRSSAAWATPTLGTARICSIFGSGSGTCTPVQVALNTASLAKGVYTAAITVSDPNALDAPQTITVTIVIGGSIPDAVDLYVSPDAGSRDSVRITTNGLLDGVPTTTGGGNWLSLAFQGQGSFAFVLPYAIVAQNPGNLAEGNYSGSLKITSATQPVDNKTVAATLHVTGQPIASLSASSIQLRASADAPAQLFNLVVSNRGRGSLALQAPEVAMASGADWLSASLVTADIIQVKATVGALAPGIYTGTVKVASNAANSGQTVPVSFEVVNKGAPVITPGGVVNNATFAGGDQLARGTIAAIFGEQFVFGEPAAASSLPLGTTLGGVRVLVNNVAAPVYFSSYGQINFQIPYDAAVGIATIVVEANGQRSNGVTVPIANRAPRLLKLGIGDYGIFVNTDGTFPIPNNTALGSAGRPARVGDTLVMYAIGLGPTSPGVASGAASPSSPLAQITPTPLVQFGRLSISGSDGTAPLFVGLTPGFVGLYQINVTIPSTVEKGSNVPVFLNMGDNVFSNTVELAIQ
ncbi:MAG TPA: hypothetical protein VFQ91_21790 [Bryobacteraceae bacterium]|nr:hypothetical protein [Bryobacteraceae bacterium]